MKANIRPDSFRIQCLLFAALATLLFLLHGATVVFTLDEGIILDAAQRVLAGQKPYVDFFGYMSPGSYWLQVLVFKLFGVSLFTARILPITGWALQATLVFRLVDQFGSRRSAIVTLILYFTSQLCNAGTLTAHHRMDSGTLVLLAICLALDARRLTSKWRWLISGILSAAAAVCTPTMAIVVVVTFIWLLLDRKDQGWLVYAGGVAATGLLAAAWIISEGTLLPSFNKCSGFRRTMRKST